MAGTDSRKAPETLAPGPVIILVEPQLGENIGMAARAMLNCGLTQLRLVNPRDGWPSEDAAAAAAGADPVIDNAKVFDTTADAVADLQLVFAATARTRDMTNRIATPAEAAGEIRALMEDGMEGGGKAGVLFGREAKGLKNDDVVLSDAIIMIPVNPAFGSLNLAQAVFAVGHEWFKGGAGPDRDKAGGGLAMPKETRPADKADLLGLFEHLEDELDKSGFFHVQEKRPVMARNIRNMLQRAGLTEQEVRTLRGVITSLVTKRGK